MSMRRRSNGSSSGGSSSSYHNPRSPEDYEVPYFTVAHYKSPTSAPTTYEFAAPTAIHAAASQPRAIQRSSQQAPQYPSAVSPMTPQGTPPTGGYMHNMNSPSYQPLTSPVSPHFGSPRSNPMSPHGPYRVPPPGVPPSIPEDRNSRSSTRQQQEPHPFTDVQQFSGEEGAGEALCSDSLDTNISPVRLAFGPALPGESWWPPDDIISPSESSPVGHTYQISSHQSPSAHKTFEDGRSSRSKERTPVDTIPEVHEHESIVQVKPSVNFTISPPTRPKRKKTPDPVQRSVKPAQLASSPSNGVSGPSAPRVARAAKVYEDATVSDVCEQLFPSDNTEKVQQEENGHESSESLTDSLEDVSTSRSKSRSPCREALENSAMKKDLCCSKSVKPPALGTIGDRSDGKSNTESAVNDKSIENKSTTESNCHKSSVECGSKVVSSGHEPVSDSIASSNAKLVERSSTVQIPPQTPTTPNSKVKPAIPPKPTPEQLQAAPRRHSTVDGSYETPKQTLEKRRKSTATVGDIGRGDSEEQSKMKDIIVCDINTSPEEPSPNAVTSSTSNLRQSNDDRGGSKKAPPETAAANVKPAPSQPQQQRPPELSSSKSKAAPANKTTTSAVEVEPVPPPRDSSLSSRSSGQQPKKDTERTARPKPCLDNLPRSSTPSSSSGAGCNGRSVVQDTNSSNNTPRKGGHNSESAGCRGGATADVTPRTPRTPRSKSREPSFCLELDYDEFPQSDAEYLALLHAKIAEAHERQLLPLKEDVADWLAKLLDEEDLCHTNLLDRLGTGVLLCRLADIVSRKAQDARQMGISQLEVPRLPYKTWERARQGSFFARDNISNFLRFCRRLGVHDNLLFETEDLVNGHGARTIVLCLLEVGRLAQNWWGLEPPAIVKLEKEMEGEEWSARSDSGYSNASSPHGSTLALNPPLSTSPVMPPSSEGAKSPRPRSAPSHLPLGARLSLPSNTLDSAESTSSSDTRETTDSGSEFKVPRTAIQNKKAATAPSGSPRAPKPTPPPKPASIRRAVNSITSGASGTTRPSSLGSSIPTPSRGWSGSKTTPCTPVTTPTHTPRTRLPIARTPRTSGRSTPNTTPTTPTQCRRYLASAKKTPSKIPCRTPTSTRTPTTGSGSAVRNTAAFITPSHGRPPVTPVSASRSAHCNRTKEDNRQLNRDLDNRVQDIARQTRGVCTCVEPSCNRTHIKKLSDGKYDVYGKSVYVRLLKDKHVMVRVGGGWDTLEHYVLSHDPTQVTMFNSRGSEPFLHIRSRYRSPTPTKNISRSVQHLSKRHVSGGGVGNKSLMNDTFVVPPQPDFDTSFGSSQSLSDGSSSQSELMDQTAGGVLIPEGDDDGGQQIMSAIESLSRSMGSPSTTRGFSPNASNGNGEAAHSSSQLATLEESPTDPSSTRIDNNNGDHSEPSASAAGEDLLSPCPCEIVPPIGAVTASCPPDVLAVSLTDSTISHSLDSTQSETTASSSANTVMLTQASMSDSMSSATLQEEADNTRMADSISSMERSQELGES